MMKVLSSKYSKEEVIKRNGLRENILDLTLDSAFKKMFTDERNKYYLAYLINYCTGFDIDYVEKHLKYKSTYLASNNLSKKTGDTDILVEIDDKLVNVEMNRQITEMLIKKNKGYMSFLESQNVEKITNNEYISKYIIQINISSKARIPNTNVLLYEIVHMDRNLKVEDVHNNQIIYDINLDYLENELYNKDVINEREKGLLIFIERNKKRLDKLYKGDDKMENILGNAKGVDYLEDEIFALEYDREAFNEIVQKEAMEMAINKAVDEAVKEAKIESFEKGAKSEKIEIAKEALKMNIPLKVISKLTKLSIKELEKIKESIKG